MEWSYSDTIGLASPACMQCQGGGMRAVYRRKITRPCDCVFRAIFRMCCNRYRECEASAASAGSTVSWEFFSGSPVAFDYSHKAEEFKADFYLIARRSLSEEEWALFELHLLLETHVMVCAARLGMDRGTVYHTIYAIERKLGRAFAETKPYGIYPVDGYFKSVSRQRLELAMGVGK